MASEKAGFVAALSWQHKWVYIFGSRGSVSPNPTYDFIFITFCLPIPFCFDGECWYSSKSRTQIEVKSNYCSSGYRTEKSPYLIDPNSEMGLFIFYLIGDKHQFLHNRIC